MSETTIFVSETAMHRERGKTRRQGEEHLNDTENVGIFFRIAEKTMENRRIFLAFTVEHGDL